MEFKWSFKSEENCLHNGLAGFENFEIVHCLDILVNRLSFNDTVCNCVKVTDQNDGDSSGPESWDVSVFTVCK